MPIIATEALAKSIGGSSASVTTNLMVTRVRAVALGCSIRNSYSNNLLVCLRDLYRMGCDGVCDSNCACQSSNCTCNATCACTGGYCECNTTCTCTTTGCSCTSGYCSCEQACDGECSNCTCLSSNCTCNTHCKCDNNYVVNCNGRQSGNGGNGSTSNTSKCTGECSADEVSWCTSWCENNTCSSACCDSGFYLGCGCNECHGGYEGWGWGCYEVWKCLGQCSPYGISCSCDKNNTYKCTCHTTCACTTTGCSCTDQCACEAKCDGECNNCSPNACIRDGQATTYKCTCHTTCACTDVCLNNCPSNG